MLNETTGDILSYVGTHRIVIPTNQLGVMGAGLALAAKKHYPGIQTAYQQAIKAGHDKRNPWMSGDYPDLILAPTKRHWKDNSLLEDVADILIKLSKIQGGPFVIPEMGCGLGGLRWRDTQSLYNIFEMVQTDWTIVHPNTKVKMYTGILR